MTDLSSSNNSLLKNLAAQLSTQQGLEELYGKEQEEQKAQLGALFKQVADNNVSTNNKAALNSTVKTLQDKVKALEEKMKKLYKEIEAKEAEVQKKTDEITELITKTTNASATMESDYHKRVSIVVEDVISLYKTNPALVGGSDNIGNEITTRLGNDSTLKSILSKGQSSVKGFLADLNSQKAQISALASEAGNLIDEKRLLDSQYRVNQSSYSLINKTIEQIGNTKTSYTNSDIDTNVPVYSLQKLDIASKLMEDTKFNVTATNSDYIAGTKKGDFSNVESSAPTQTTGEPTTREEVRDGKKYLITEQTITTSHTETMYPKDTYSQAGNTMDSNEQLSAFGNNYTQVLNILKENNFTFKEAMYLMFNEENGLFKDCGIKYDLSKQEGNQFLEIAEAGDSKTAKMYGDFASKVKSIWGSDIHIDNKNTSIKPTTITDDIETKKLGEVEQVGPAKLPELEEKLDISKAEQELLEKLIKEGKVDLTEKLDDGSPRYIFAQGVQDKKYHVYDMKQRGADGGASLARMYGNKNTSPRGADIVPNGNGYIYNFKKGNEDGSGKYEYFYFDTQETTKSARANYSTCSPLVFDLTGEGININTDKIVEDDIDGDGIKDKHFDIGANNAVLVWDADKNGVSGEGGSEYFGNNTVIDGVTYENGFEALKALAKKEGLINGEDDNELNEEDIKFLQDNYGFKIKAGSYDSEATSLLDAGITSIKLSTDKNTTLNETYQNTADNVMTQNGATFTINGQEREYADVWHKKLDAESINNLKAPETKADNKKYVDPLTFRQGDVEYAFLIDKNNDGKITDATEFVGGKEGASWLDDLKSLDKDGDGKLTGDELSELKLVGTKYEEAQNTDKKSQTNVEYIMTNAKDMGIEEIDLNDLEQQVNQSQGKTDLNGTKLYNDSIKFKMNGETVTASRKDETSSFMNAIYKDAEGKRFKIGGFSQNVVDAAFNQADKKLSSIEGYIPENDEKFQQFVENTNMLKNFDKLYDETVKATNIAEQRMQSDKNAQINEAVNIGRGDSSSANGWRQIETDLRTIATTEHIIIDMAQAKGIYSRNNFTTAKEVYDEYKRQKGLRTSNENLREHSQEAMEALIKCYKIGINVTMEEIKDIILNNNASTADSIYNAIVAKQSEKNSKEK